MQEGASLPDSPPPPPSRKRTIEGDEGSPPKKKYIIDITKPVFGPLRQQMLGIQSSVPTRNYVEEVRYTVEADLKLQLENEAKREEMQKRDEEQESMEVDEATTDDTVANVPLEKSMENSDAILSDSVVSVSVLPVKSIEHTEATDTDVVENVTPEDITTEPDINQMLLGVTPQHPCCCVCCPNGTTHPEAPLTPTNKGRASKASYKCEVCGREFAKATNYHRHMERFK